MTFRVGQKVVCVDASGLKWTVPLVAGAIYTIREIYGANVGGPGLMVEEILNGPHPDGLGEFGYRLSRFRPVVERKTDISIFTAMLDPSKVEA